MKKNLFLLFVASFMLLVSCSKEDEFDSPEEVNNLKSTAVINAGTVQQTIKGFGGAVILNWQSDLTETQRIKAFSPYSGMGLSIVRVRVSPNSADWAANKATIDKCKYYGGSAIATAWTAPASMKDNNKLIGGKLKTSSYASYAAHLKAFNIAVGGVSAISPVNEPNYKVSYECMEMTASEVASFVASQGSNCGAPIMAPEPYNFDKTYITTYLSNSTAKAKTAAVCGHIYGKTPYYYNFGKPVWMTEHYVNSSVSGNDWPTAMKVAKEIHDCMNVGWSAYVWWYIRRSYGPMDENGNVTKTGYVMTHFAKWIRPGYSKISCSASPTPGVYTTAYKSGSKLVIVAINTNSAITYQSFNVSGISYSGFDRYKTTSSSNLIKDSFSARSGFGINLPASSITTLVSK
ncbi:MAG: hypothetical protein JW717_08590 [Marinilabiliaceae bacterium]|nr:hypothetical protein [Marinilabiliaceae bacterium]